MKVIDLTDQVAQAISYFSERVHQKHITVINQVNDYQPVVADAQQLAIILRNLVDNAVKFTPAGGYIRLLTIPHTNTIELQIRDTGIGMTTEMKDKLFTQPEVRKGTQEEPGTGLGIQICRALVEKQNGQLIIESQPNKGTTITIILAKAIVSANPSVLSVCDFKLIRLFINSNKAFIVLNSVFIKPTSRLTLMSILLQKY